MKRTRTLLVAGILAYLIFVLATFPAAAVLPRFLPQGVSLSGIQGSIWKGTALRLATPAMATGDLRWSFAPTGLFLGRLAYDVYAELPDGFARGRVGTRFGGLLKGTDIEAAVGIDKLTGVLPADKYSGELILRFASIDLDDGRPVSLIGTADLANLFQLRPQQMALGSFQAEFDGSTDDSGALVGVLRSLGGPMVVDGTIRLLPDRTFVVGGLVSAGPEATADLVSGLRYLGAQDANGRFQFSFEGSY